MAGKPVTAPVVTMKRSTTLRMASARSVIASYDAVDQRVAARYPTPETVTVENQGEGGDFEFAPVDIPQGFEGCQTWIGHDHPHRARIAR